MCFLRYAVFSLLVCCCYYTQAQDRWSVQKTSEWYQHQDWLTGANFIPSTAINQLEMWQEETFDTAIINRELGYAEGIGFNIMRVYLHHVAWQQDPEGFKSRLNQYLTISARHQIKTMFVFFDDCWMDTYSAGKQPLPRQSVHNSGWLKDPGSRIDDTPALMDTLEIYVKDILNTFKDDERILVWDLYNEPGHFKHGDKSWPLLRNVVKWARTVHLDQPITIGLWNPAFSDFNAFQIANSDVISFHNYRDSSSMLQAIDTLQAYGRPLLCTEYMKRPNNSTFATIFPILKRNGVAAINWGLVAGKTQTNYPQGNKGGEAEPEVWYHDIFHKDGTPFDLHEVELIRKLNTPVLTDGPYISYQNGRGYSCTISNNVPMVDSFPEEKKTQQEFEVHSSQGDHRFSLKLHSLDQYTPCQYTSPGKLLVVSDIEGEFSSFVQLMKSCGVIDANYKWVFGDGHLVICGDLFDRGKDVAAYLWLLYKLDEEAIIAGGYVHVILGNHDIMNLSGDYRYVASKYSSAASLLQKNYKELYAKNTELGRWLRSKNIIEKIGNMLFLHAGVSPELNKRAWNLEAINNNCRKYYDQSRKVIPDSLQIFFSADGPFWYRGYFMGKSTTDIDVNKTLAFYGCKQIVVGHTIVDSIKSMYNGKVIGVDVNHHNGNHQALMIENGTCYILHSDGTKILLNTKDI